MRQAASVVAGKARRQMRLPDLSRTLRSSRTVHAPLGQQPPTVTLSFSSSPTAMVCRCTWLPFCSLLLAFSAAAAAYEVPITHTDYDHQICSGMWGGKNTYINGVTWLLAAFMYKAQCNVSSHIRRHLTWAAFDRHIRMERRPIPGKGDDA